MSLNKNLQTYLNSLNIEEITDERKQTLQPLIDFIQFKRDNNKPIRLNFICTHNSRRSHLSQIWAKTMAYYFDISNVDCYSGGTEATALFSMVAVTLEKKGFKIKKLSEGENPIYSIRYAENEHPIIGFSKQWKSEFNPKSEFCVIMTCSQADENCPLIWGAEKRIPITYQDPKISDNTPLQSETYLERSKQIATEMFYVFSIIK